MGGLGPRGDPHYDLFYLLNNDDIFHDIYVISSQECMQSIGKSFLDTSKEMFNQALIERLGPNYAFIHAVSLQALNLTIISTRKLAPHISNIESAIKKTGTGNFANKGGARISFQLASSKICFLAAHLTSDEGNIEKRNSDMQSILTSLVFNKPSSAKKEYKKLNWEDTDYDAVVLAGDLNYRVFIPLTKVKPMLE